ncbi:MAG: hypothetical protein WDO71_18395 [Bacteroidota bacterium]
MGPLGNYFVNAGSGKINLVCFLQRKVTKLQQMDEKDIQWTPVSGETADKLAVFFR